MTQTKKSYARELYTKEALSYVPHLLEILDRSPVSKTYGCFDREYWHYKAKGFASGMYEEYVLTLALVYVTNFEGNVYFNNTRVRDFVEAGINFAKGASHKNGSNDDYYPNEEAFGSTSFSLYACTESYLLLDLHNKGIEDFFRKRADFLINREESGTLSNHHAIAAVALYNVFEITRDKYFKEAAEEKIKEVLTNQSEEGWFMEYEGCDPGYLTFTIDFLAKYLQKNPGHATLKKSLGKAVEFCFWTIHPDGSYGGEYGSRNTFHFLPNGFEILSHHFPKAIYVRNAFMQSLQQQTRSRIDDDRIFNHYVYNYIQAFTNHDESLLERPRTGDFEKLFREAGLFVRNKGDVFLICSLKKNGVFKLYKNNRLEISDCGLVLETTSGKKLISQVWQEKPIYSISNNSLSIEANFSKFSQILPSPAKLVLFRIATITSGRLLNRAIRVVLQKILILSKSKSSVSLKRTFVFKNNELRITDTINNFGKNKFEKVFVASDFTAIYVATGQPFTQSTLVSWMDYSDEITTLNKTGELTLSRKY